MNVPPSSEGGSWLYGIPVKTSRLWIPILRLVFRRRGWIQIGKRVYVLRDGTYEF